MFNKNENRISDGFGINDDRVAELYKIFQDGKIVSLGDLIASVIESDIPQSEKYFMMILIGGQTAIALNNELQENKPEEG